MQSSMEPDPFLKNLGKFKCMNQILKSEGLLGFFRSALFF